MFTRKTLSVSIIATLVLTLVLSVGGATLLAAGTTTVPAVTGLKNPRGLSPAFDSGILIAEGVGGRLLKMAPNGSITVIRQGLPATTTSGPNGSDPSGIASAIAVGNTRYYVTGEKGTEGGTGFSTLWRLRFGQAPEALADLAAYEAANNPDSGTAADGSPDIISNPYDLAAAPGGGIFVSDASGNDILHVDDNGNIKLYALFPRRDNPLFGTVGGPTMDEVPTGIAVGPDNALYVATLTGFPFPKGAARVYRLADGNGDGDALDSGEKTVFAEGLTTATDLAFQGGSLLVTEFSTDMLAGAPGRLVRHSKGTITEVVGNLTSPTSVTVSNFGRIFVSQEFAGVVSEVILPISAPTADLGGSANYRDADALSDSLVISLTGVPAPSVGTQYEGWLVKANGDKISTGILRVAGGEINTTFKSATKENLAASYLRFVITSEPILDPDKATPGDVLYSDSVPSGVFAHVGHLVVAWPSNPGGVGIAVGLRGQSNEAFTHAQLASNSSTLSAKQAHAHHVVNIIEGTSGANYDANFAGPGDGFGVLNYANDAITHATLAKNAAPDNATVVAKADEVIAAANNVIALSERAVTSALRIINASADNITVSVSMANMVNDTRDALRGVDQDADGVLSGSEGGARTVYTKAQDIAQFEPLAGSLPDTPVTGDTLVPMAALVTLIAGVTLVAAGGFLVFRRRTA